VLRRARYEYMSSVLICDDDEGLCLTLSDYLTDEGLKVQTLRHAGALLDLRDA
jgi:DNA-binding NtrC family response regulator